METQDSHTWGQLTPHEPSWPQGCAVPVPGPCANLYVTGLSQQGTNVSESAHPDERTRLHHTDATIMPATPAGSRLILRHGSQPQDTWRLRGCTPASRPAEPASRALQSQSRGRPHAAEAQRERHVRSCRRGPGPGPARRGFFPGPPLPRPHSRGAACQASWKHVSQRCHGACGHQTERLSPELNERLFPAVLPSDTENLFNKNRWNQTASAVTGKIRVRSQQQRTFARVPLGF